MRKVLVTALLTVGLASGAALAQDAAAPEAVPETSQDAPAETPTPAPTTAAPQIAPPEGPPTSREEVDFNQAYLQGEYTDWSVRCIKLDEPQDVCEMHQSLTDQNGTRTAEINIFPLNRGQVAAGGTIVTPLETILTESVRLSVDGGETKVYPFTFCNRVGCVAQIGFLQSEVDTFRRGRTATVQIVPLAAPNQNVVLTVSLAGFTAAYEAITP